MRNYAMIVDKEDRDVLGNLAEKIREYDPTAKVHLFAKSFSKDVPDWVEKVDVPEENAGSGSKFHNFVLMWFVEKGFKGFLHVFSDSIGIDSSKMGPFSGEIEEMIKIFGYDVWMNTFTDECNFVFEKWISRINVVMDHEEFAKKYSKTTMWMSNANTNFMIYDLDNLVLEDALFDDRFSIAMFYIIKFFAERRNKNRPGSFMNFYPTLESEKGVIHTMKYSDEKDSDDVKEKMKKEGELFKSLNLNYSGTENVEPVLEFIRNKLENYNKENN